MKPYLMYLRKSRADRDFSDEPVMQTLQRHRKRLDEFCAARGIHIPEENVLCEVAGADSVASRPKMMELLGLVESGAYEGVLCVDMDRLSRGSGADQALVINTFKYSGTKIITPAKTYDFSSEMDEQFAELGLFMGRNEYRQIKKRLMQGRIDAIKEGKYPNGVAPYGYTTYKLPKQKGFSLKVNEEEAEIVRLIFQKYTEENMGAQKIARWLNDHGYRGRDGHDWLGAQISKVLKNPTYIGKVRFGNRIQTKMMRDGLVVSTLKNNTDDALVCDGLHEPIIAEDVFKRARWVRDTHYIPHTKKSLETQNPLCGIIKCSHCGRSMALRSPDQNGERGLFCPTPGCVTKSVYLSVIEPEVKKFLGEWLEGYEVIPKAEHFGSKINEAASDIEKAQNDLSAERHRKERIYELLESGVYTEEEYRERMDECHKRIDRILSTISEDEAHLLELKEYEAQMKNMVPTVRTVLQQYDMAAKPIEKNRLLKKLFEKIIITKDLGGKKHAREFTLEFYPKIPKIR